MYMHVNELQRSIARGGTHRFDYIHVYLALTQLAACEFKSSARQNSSKVSTETNIKQQQAVTEV